MLKTLCHLPHLKLFFLVFPLQKIKREPFLAKYRKTIELFMVISTKTSVLTKTNSFNVTSEW